jgi:hypothetical protein
VLYPGSKVALSEESSSVRNTSIFASPITKVLNEGLDCAAIHDLLLAGDEAHGHTNSLSI